MKKKSVFLLKMKNQKLFLTPFNPKLIPIRELFKDKPKIKKK